MEEIDIILLELLFFFLLIGERFDHFLPEQAVPDLHALFAESLPHTQVNGRAGHYHNRHNRKEDQRQGQTDSRQYDKRDDRFDTRNKKFLRTVMGKLRHVKKVIRNPAHDLTDLRIIIVGIRQFLQMRISVPPHIRLDSRAHHMSRVSHIEVRHRIYDTQAQIQYPETENHRYRERRQIIHPRVRDKPDNHR